MFRFKGIQKLKQLSELTSHSHGYGGRTHHIMRHFSTQVDNPTPQSQDSQPLPQQSPIDSFLYPPNTGLVYGRLTGITHNTLKTDIISLFEGCNLTLDDIKVDYDRIFYPMAMLVQFSSMSNFNGVFKELARKNRYFKLEKVDRQQWDLVTPYNGRYVLFQGIPRNALIDDVERLLCGCKYDGSSLEIFTRSVQYEPVRMAKVRFPSQIEAMNAVVRKNGAFCLNSRVMTRLIQ